MPFIMGKLAGGLSFGTFSLAIKEKILAHEGRNPQLYASTTTKKEPAKENGTLSRAPAQNKKRRPLASLFSAD